MPEAAAISALLQVINAGGTLGLLAFFVWAFYDGQIISKKTLDKILESYKEQMEVMFQKAIQDVLTEIKRNKSW